MNMRIFHARTRARIAVLTLLSLVTSPVEPLLLAQTPSTKAPAEKAAATATAPAVEGWPRAYTTASGAALVIYQPQVASWADQKHVVAVRGGVLHAEGRDASRRSARVKVESDTSVALDERLVSFSEFKITESNFPTLKREQLRTVVEEIAASVPLDERVIALDRVLANIDTSQIIPKNVEGVKADPPPIFFSKTPAVLVNIDGDPIWSPIAQNDLKSAVNTNWDLFEHGPTKTFYLRNDTVLAEGGRREGAVDAGRHAAGELREAAGRRQLEGREGERSRAQTVSASQAPKVFVSTTPAELILLRGAPNYLRGAGHAGAAVGQQHRERRVPDGHDGPVYFLVVGPLVLGAGLHRPVDVRHAEPAGGLQEDPARAPALARARVGAGHAAGGRSGAARADSADRARRARTVQAPEVAYQGGTPQFQPIEKTTRRSARSTPTRTSSRSATSTTCASRASGSCRRAPTGPWEVTGDGAEGRSTRSRSARRRTTSPTSPVEESNNDAVVFATAAAYTGMMVAWGCASGAPATTTRRTSGTAAAIPYYYPYYPTYGYGASYNPWTGAYRRGAVGVRSVRRRRRRRALQPADRHLLARRGRPTVRTARAARRRPTTRAPARTARRGRARTSTAAGDRPASSAATSGPRRRASPTTRPARRRARRRASGGGAAVSRSGPAAAARRSRGPAAATSTPATTATSTASRATAGRSTTAAAGTTSSSRRRSSASRRKRMRRTGSLHWDSSTAQQVNRDSAARAEGNQRTRDASSMRSGASSRSGSYRAGGGARGGGRRR